MWYLVCGVGSIALVLWLGLCWVSDVEHMVLSVVLHTWYGICDVEYVLSILLGVWC